MRTKSLEDFLKKIRGNEGLEEEKAFREHYALLHVIFDQSFSLMGLMKPDGTLIKINPTAYGFIKCKESDVIGKPFWETPWWTHSLEQRERLREAIMRAGQGAFVRFEATHPTPDGKIIYVDFSIKPVKDEKGNVVLLVPEGRDITERKRAEEALREAVVKYKIVADNTYNWEFWLSPEGRFIYTSPSCQRVSGYTDEAFNADPGLIWKIVHPDDRQLLTDHRHDITQVKALGEVEFRIVRPDGDIRWIHHVCQPVFDDNGSFLGTRGSFSDITIRKQAEEKNLRLAGIVESSDDAIIGKTVDGIITSWNRGAERIFGYSESEVLGKPITILVPPEYRDEVVRVHERTRRGEHIEHFETVSKRKDGELIYMLLTYSPIRDAQGRVVAVSTIGRDISERKRAEEALREAAVKYRIVADNTYNWEFWLSPEGRFIYTSPSCQRVSGHEAEEFNTDPGLVLRIIHPDDRRIWIKHRDDITQTMGLGDIEFRTVRPDGEIRWIHHICMPVFDDNGNFLGTRGSFSDITVRKQAEEKNLRLAAIVESSDDAIVGKTVDGIITSWNRGAEKIFGYNESEVLGKPITMLIPAEYVNEILQTHERIKRGEHVEHFETVRRRKDGELIYMSLTYSPIRDTQGRVVAVSTIGRDITEQKKAAVALLDNARINRELEIAKEIQQSFLPVCPSALPGMFMTCCCVPAAHVGGDYYDFFPLEDGVVDAVIADVTGHSVGSSLLMAMVRSVLHAKVSSSRSPGTLLAAVNDLLHDDLSRVELLISMFYIRLDTENHTLAYANAGHNPPFLFSAKEGAFIKLDADGLLMGVKTDVNFEEKSTLLASGDILILYTDGVTEAENAEGELFGTGRLCGAIAKYCECHPKEIMAGIFQELTAFTLSDDVAMIIFKFI